MTSSIAPFIGRLIRGGWEDDGDRKFVFSVRVDGPVEWPLESVFQQWSVIVSPTPDGVIKERGEDGRDPSGPGSQASPGTPAGCRPEGFDPSRNPRDEIDFDIYGRPGRRKLATAVHYFMAQLRQSYFGEEHGAPAVLDGPTAAMPRGCWFDEESNRLLKALTPAPGIETGTATTEGRGPKDESPIRAAEAPASNSQVNPPPEDAVSQPRREDALKAACETWRFGVGDPPSDDSPLIGPYSAGIGYAINRLAKLTDAGEYVGADGSETFEGDVDGTIMNVLRAARLYDDETGEFGRIASSDPTTGGEAPGRDEPAAWRDVLAERLRQTEAEGWTPDHDDAHDGGELARAAAAYARHAGSDEDARQVNSGYSPEDLWPWIGFWKPSDRRRDLVKAGALILAEIERLDRLSASPRSPQKGEGV